jgi:DNA-dependent RNA polymerase auxiliary subunit epsilon
MNNTNEKAREDKIRKYLQDPEYHTEEIFKLSNVMCEGGCEEYMTKKKKLVGAGVWN